MGGAYQIPGDVMNEYPKMLYSDFEHYAIAADFEAEQQLRDSGFVDYVTLLQPQEPPKPKRRRKEQPQ